MAEPTGPDQFEQDVAQEKQAYAEEVAREVAEQKAFNERAKAAALAAREQRQPEYEALKQRQAALEATPPPTLTKPPTPPDTQRMLQPSSLQQTMGLASIFALLSVGLGKGSAIYGLKALGGFMEGAHAGNVERAEAAHKDFIDNMSSVKEANDNAMAEYNAIIGNRKLSLDSQERMLKIKALEFQDELSLQALEQGGMNAVHSRLRDLAKTNFEYTKELDRHKEMQARIAQGKASGRGTTTEEYKLMLADRANGGMTGNPMVDKLTPEQAKQMAGLVPKATQASTKARDQLIGTSNVLKEIEALIPEMDEKGFLAKSKGRISYETASFNRWRKPADPVLAKWKSLQGSIVGFDRAVFNDIGARVKAAFEGSLDLFDKPYTAQGLRDAIKGYQRILMDSPEAKRALSQEPGAFSGGGPPGFSSGGGGGGSKEQRLRELGF